MVAGRQKSTTFRKVHVRLPGGKTAVHYKKRNKAKQQCANCGDFLKGADHSLSMSKKRPERPYGGVLCSRCMRTTIIQKYRNIFKLND